MIPFWAVFVFGYLCIAVGWYLHKATRHTFFVVCLSSRVELDEGWCLEIKHVVFDAKDSGQAVAMAQDDYPRWRCMATIKVQR